MDVKKSLSIEIKEPLPFFTHPLVRALIWSALFHLCLLCAFRVKMSYFHTTESPLTSVAVAIEEDALPATTTTIENEQQMTQLIANLDNSDWDEIRETTSEWPRDHIKASHQPKIHSCGNIISETAITFLPESFSHQSTLYPLRIKTSPNLKKLKILTDGSSLFKQTENSEKLHQLLMSSSRFRVQYTVNINGKNGRITKWNRESHLIDPAVQSCADMVIERLCFAPFGDKTMQGTLYLVFYCDGQELQQFLKRPIQ